MPTEARADAHAELLSRLIHDVKNPLAVVLSYAEEIPAAPEAERAEFCARLAVNARRALQMLDDFALLSALRHNCLDLTLAETDWPALVREAIDEVTSAHPGWGVSLVFEPVGAATVRIDRVWLRHALCSFLREALRALRGAERLELTIAADRLTASLKIAVPRGGRYPAGALFDDAEVSVEVLQRTVVAHGGTFDVLLQPVPTALLRLPR